VETDGGVELFWVDLVMQNPLTTELSLSDLTLEVEATSDNVTKSDLGIESLAEVRLYPKESRVVSYSLFILYFTAHTRSHRSPSQSNVTNQPRSE
jgi:hypothetical protein